MSNNYELYVEFLGTLGTHEKNVYKEHYGSDKRIGFSNSENKKSLCFDGADILNFGPTSSSNTYKKAIKLIPEIVNGWNPNNSENVIKVNLRGHSRGSVVCDMVYNKLKGEFRKYKNVTLKMEVSDPYAGPTANGKEKMIRINKLDISDGLSVATYATQTLFRCTPQQISGADIVIIINTGHNKSWMPFYRDYPKERGLYLAYYDERECACNYVKIVKAAEPIKEFFDFIYKYGKVTQTSRWRLFVKILIQKLDMSYDDLEKIVAIPKSIMFPNMKKEFDKVLGHIEKSINLTTAFDIAICLFQPCGLFSGLGGKTFHEHLYEAKKCVCGIKNNNYKGAINHLSAIVSKDGRPPKSIKTLIANALIKRVKKWYNIEQDDPPK